VKFVPDTWKPREADIEWAKKTFKITGEEVARQLEEFRDHEFRRDYTDFNRCFRNWFRTADKFELLKRERVYVAPVYSEAETEADRTKAWARLNQLKGMASNVGAVKK